jgi:hypothetical protein
MRKFKTMKVFLDGVRLKDVYPYATKLEVAKYKIAKFMREVVRLTIFSLIISGIAIGVFMYYFPNRVIVSQITTDTLTPKIEEIQNKALADLKDCESGGVSESVGLITFDPHQTNKKVEEASLGSFQFKKATVIHYYKTLYQKDITGKEAVLIALDDNKAEQLTKDIIFTTDNGKDNWLLCAKKINLDFKLQTLKMLE